MPNSFNTAQIFGSNKKIDQFVTFLLFCWSITLPLRNSVLTFNIAGIEIYPNLIFTFLIAFYFLFINRPSYLRIQYIVLAITALTIFQIIIWIFFNGLDAFAIFDAHSFVMQFAQTFIVFSLFQHLTWEEFQNRMSTLFKYYFLLLAVFGLFEMLTYFHLEGPNVLRLQESTFNSTFIAPYFIYDNNNDYCLYLFLSLNLWYITLTDSKNKTVGYLIGLAMVLLIALLAQARLIVLISSAFIFIHILVIAYQWIKSNFNKNQLVYFVSILFSFIIILLYNPVFNTKKYLKTYKSKANNFILIDSTFTSYRSFKSLDTTSQHAFLKATEKQYLKDHQSTSSMVRMNLLYNGLEMIQQEPLFGIGPGQFTAKHKKETLKHDTKEITNPHNFVIELISQYGLVGWCYFVTLIVLFFAFLKQRFNRFDLKVTVLLLIALYPILGLVPSSFLYINLHWFVLPILVCIYINNRRTNKI